MQKNLIKGLLLAGVLFLGQILPVRASMVAEPEMLSTLTEKCDSVFNVELVYMDEQNEAYRVKAGNGFLIGSAGEEASYVITGRETITATEETCAQALQEYGVEMSENLQPAIRLVVKKDVVINATLLTESEEMGFAVLELEQPVHGREALAFSSEPQQTQAMETVYSLWDNRTVTEGQIFKWQDENEISSFLHTSIMNGQGSGSPVLDEMGNVIGVNTALLETGYMEAVNIAEVVAVLDVFGVPYTVATPVQPEDESVPEETLETVEETPTVSVNASAEPTTPADLPSEETAFPVFLWVGIGMFVLVLIGIIILIIRIGAGDKKEPPKKHTTDNAVEQNRKQVMPGTFSEETTILGMNSSGLSEETTILGSGMGWETARAYLIREKNGERITINKSAFIIGSDGLRVDYCIKDNKSVSRVHATIRQTNEQFFLEDMHATNGTYLKGCRLKEAEVTVLRSGDSISLANEKFVFYV